MNCDICNAELPIDEHYRLLHLDRDGKTLYTYEMCGICSHDIETQVDMLKRLHKDKNAKIDEY